MKSFRTELENPIVEKDIIELERKIRQHKNGEIDDERFRSLRLARGVYGQRQLGVQMIRIKLPFGRVTGEQLHRIANVSDEYSKGRLHITTRQDIQIHHVSLDRTPELWAELEKDDITLREACGNAVRNVTASETAGIDATEAFDVSPYADAVFKFFLRNPICQDMGRKFKISFSGSDDDTALSFIHDLGFIAKVIERNGVKVKGFKVMIAGGLGSQPRAADVAFEFIETDKLIPTIEGVIRVFDRLGERNKRAKARLKFLVKDIGLSEYLKLVEEEQSALAYQNYPIDTIEFDRLKEVNLIKVDEQIIEDEKAYLAWRYSNVIQQKQHGLFAIGVKVFLGDFYTDKARILADLIKKYAGNELRLTLRQDILIRDVREDLLPFFYNELKKLNFVQLGYNSTHDITACPGTDTCNLGISSSTGIASELEKVLKEEYPYLVNGQDITIKISGCMNACGQHNMAQIGFQGMSVKAGTAIAPALQVLLGGSVIGNGAGRFADKVIKIPSKRGPEALRLILNDFENNNSQDDSFVEYYDEKGKLYFYDLLKPLADVTNLKATDFVDWGHDEKYIKAIGIGECAGVMIDLVTTLLFESEEKIELAHEAFNNDQYADSIYHAYTAMINVAKAALIGEDVKTNTQAGIVKDFDINFIDNHQIDLKGSFTSLVYQIKNNEPTKSFATAYLKQAKSFYKQIDDFRLNNIENEI